MKLLYIIFFINLFNFSNSSTELELRNKLFNNYDVNRRPVLNVNDNVDLQYGIEVKSLEFFDQKAENIKFNIWMTLLWTDQYLSWNKSNYNLDYITIQSSDIWIPDLELYNAAAKPIIYDKYGSLQLYNNGHILWVRPTQYSFSCPLQLANFPFDNQNCTMLFGSWKYSANFLDIKPFNYFKDDNIFQNISIDKDFSNNEWNIVDTYVKHDDIEYLCCPGELWANSFYSIKLERNFFTYMIVISMTILLTITALVLILFPITNYMRTFVLVFIPLSIIWLQVYISDKIPVIEYYTLMDQILLTSFLITTANAFESSILYCIINENFEWLKIFYKKNELNTYNKNADFKDVKIILNTLNNKIIYKNLYKYVLIIDNCFRVLMYLGFIITIGVLLL